MCCALWDCYPRLACTATSVVAWCSRKLVLSDICIPCSYLLSLVFNMAKKAAKEAAAAPKKAMKAMKAKKA